MILYLSGAITNVPNYKHAFTRAEWKYKLQRHTVLNPAMLPESKELTYDAYMRMSIALLAEADGIVMLKGWEKSKGANIELEYAKQHGKQVIFDEGNL